MARDCTVCAHPARQSIDDALTSGGVASVLAGRYGLSTHALSRHKRAHLTGDGQHTATGGEPGGWQPAFPGQRPPFQPGHTLSLRHGSYSPRTVDPLAVELVEGVLAEPATADLAAAHWRPALDAWARAEVQVQLLTEYLARAGEETGDGVGDLGKDTVLSAYLLLHRAEARAATGRARLGLDPLSAARLGRDRAAGSVDMARLMAGLAGEQQRPVTVGAERVHGDAVEGGGVG